MEKHCILEIKKLDSGYCVLSYMVNVGIQVNCAVQILMLEMPHCLEPLCQASVLKDSHSICQGHEIT